jgi:ribonuclease P protein subunit RPR2
MFIPDVSGRVRLVVAEGSPTVERVGGMEQAAIRRLSTEHLTTVPSQPTRDTYADDHGRPVIVAPAALDGQLQAVIVATELAAPHSRSAVSDDVMASLLISVSLSAERLQMLEALERREDEIGALREQLDVYAMDFRSTYIAERDRSQQLAEALAELENTYKATVRGLAVAVEAKDECTGGHLQRVSRYGMMLTAHAADPQFEYGFLLHDVGKLTVPDSVLMKPGALTEAEWALIREHPASGRSILDGIPFLAGAREIVYSHHERWDGTGYPRGLAGADIPLGAQIFPLCDAFDAPCRSTLRAARSPKALARSSGRTRSKRS